MPMPIDPIILAVCVAILLESIGLDPRKRRWWTAMFAIVAMLVTFKYA